MSSSDNRKRRRQRRLIELGRNATKIADENIELSKSVANLRFRLGHLAHVFEQRSQLVRRLSSALRECRADRESLQSVVATKCAELASTRNELAAAQRQIEQLRADVAELPKLRRRLRERSNRLGQLQTQVCQLERQVVDA